MRAAHLLGLSGWLFVGCAASGHRSLPVVAPASPGGARFAVPEVVGVRCWPLDVCTDPLTLTLTNDAAGPTLVTRVVMNGGALRAVDFDAPPRLAPDEHLVLPAALGARLRPGLYRLYAATDRGIVEHTFTLVDAAEEEARVECLARGDDWEGGKDHAGACRAVMPDAGWACGDARDCQGFCEQVARVEVSRDFDRVTGVCSRHASELGCHTRIGHTAAGLVPHRVRFPRRCAC